MPKLLTRRKIYLIWTCIFVLALGLRLIYLVHLRKLPFFDHPVMDALYHDTWAREILSGTTRHDPFFRGPLYPYFLALIYLAGKGSYLVPRLVQFILGGFTAVITFSLARRYFGLLAGVVAGVLCAVYPVIIYFDGELLTETLFIFLSMFGLLAIETAGERRAWFLWFAGGLILGLALIARPNIALFLPVAVVGAVIRSGRRMVPGLVLLAGMVIPLAPVTIHNYVASGEVIPLVWQGGINFYLGNNATATGWSATSPEIRKDWWGGYNDMIAIPREVLGREPSYNEVSDYWTRKGLTFIKTQPLGWLRLILRKTALSWSSMEFPNNQDYNFMKLYSWVLRNPLVTFGTVAPLSLVALFVFWRDARRLGFLYGLFLTSFLGTLAFFVCDRYRLPSLPPMMIFAGGLVACLARLVAARRRARLVLYVACLIAAALVGNLNLTGERLPDFAQSYCGLGKVYVSMGNDAEAMIYFDRAIAVNPTWGEAYEQIGLLKMKEGENQAAVAYLLQAAKVWPDLATPHRALAMIYLSEDRLAEARQAIQNALRLAPFLEDAHNVLGSIQGKEGEPDSAIAAFTKEVEINPSSWRAYANLGSVYEETGKSDQAVEAYQKSLDLNPDNPDVALALATIHAESGRYDLARPLLDRAGSDSVSNLNLKYNRGAILQQGGKLDEARQIYEGILKENEYHEGALVNLGVIYAKQGLTAEAWGLWQRALAINPANQTAKRNLELLGEPQ